MKPAQVSVLYDDTISHTPAARLILHALQANADEFNSLDATGLPAATRVLYALDGSDIVGVLCFIPSGLLEAEWIVNVGFVKPEHRERGVFTALYAALEERAKQYGVQALSVCVHPDNHRAVKAVRSLGLHLRGMRFERIMP